MLIDRYYTESNNTIIISRQQASDFAKQIADDFNPLHDIHAKKFCVPGDLLFSLILGRYGINQQMTFTFSDMVNDVTDLKLPASDEKLELCDDNGKNYISVERRGENCTDTALIDKLTHSYVSFSGMTFPHLLVPLLKEQDVMINPERPLVIYQSMVIDLQTLDLHDLELQLNPEQTTMEVKGKRGNACLAFDLISNGSKIGCGQKHMVLGGLKAFEQHAVDVLIDDYNNRKEQFKHEYSMTS